MAKLRVALGDLRHDTRGAHSTYAPIAIGYIGSYLQSQIPDVDFEIRLYTRPDEVLDDIDNWSPHIVAMSSYLWNSSLSNRTCEYAKETIDNVLCIMGGPEFPSGTGQFDLTINADLCLEYLLERPAIDYYCYSDGETAVLSVVKEYIKAGCSVAEMKRAGLPLEGTAAVNSVTQELIVGTAQSRIGLGIKGKGRDAIPSPYTSGMMDKFLDGNFIPSIETQRGCPFQCTFCDQGLDSTKIVAFSVERICEELNYIAKKVSHQKAARTIAFHDSNFGMFAHDYQISEHMLTLINEYDWPRNVEISTPKNKKELILEIDSMLKNRVAIGLAQQSMNRDTLEEIKRDNYSNEEYLEFVKELGTRGKPVACELIIPLPGETEQSFHDSVKMLCDNGLSISVYTLMMLYGSELGRRHSRTKYSLGTRFRVLPRQFGEYRGKRVFDVEEVCVESDTMPFKAYCRSRRFSFIISLFSNKVFDPLRRHILEMGQSYYDFLTVIHRYLEDESGATPLHDVYRSFSFESEAELFQSREALVSFFDDAENYQKLLDGDLGDNLLRKYRAKMVLHHLKELVDCSYDLIIEHFETDFPTDDRAAIDDVKSWIVNRNFIGDLLIMDPSGLMKNKIVNFSYDVPKWYESENKSLKEFQTDVTYSFTSKYDELKSELSGLFGDSAEYQLGKMMDTRPISEFFCDYTRVE